MIDAKMRRALIDDIADYRLDTLGVFDMARMARAGICAELEMLKNADLMEEYTRMLKEADY